MKKSESAQKWEQIIRTNGLVFHEHGYIQDLAKNDDLIATGHHSSYCWVFSVNYGPDSQNAQKYCLTRVTGFPHSLLMITPSRFFYDTKSDYQTVCVITDALQPLYEKHISAQKAKRNAEIAEAQKLHDRFLANIK